MAARGYNGVRLAGWWRRVAAVTIDTLAVLGIGLVLFLLAFGAEIAKSEALVFLLFLASLAAFVGLVIYNFIVMPGQTGKTVGKHLVNIRVVNGDTGLPTGIGMAVGRHFAHYLDAYSFYLGYFWPLWDDKCQTFHDKVCNTVVVMDRKQLAPHESSFRYIQQPAYQPQYQLQPNMAPTFTNAAPSGPPVGPPNWL